MVSNFYGSTQSRLKTYTADRRVEERNGDIQQAKVYQQLAEDRGDTETADRLSKLATLVVNKFGQQVQQTVVPTGEQAVGQPFDIRTVLKSAIQNGTLSQLWDRIKAIPNSKLSPVARVIQHDLKHNKLLKSLINEKLQPILEQHLVKQGIKQKSSKFVDSIVQDVIQTIVGSKENEGAFSEIIQQAGGMTSISENVEKQIREQRAKFGTNEDDDKTETGSIAGVSNRGAPIQYNNIDEYVQANMKYIDNSTERSRIRRYLRERFGLSIDEAKLKFPTPEKKKK